jgi:hypothetical protein
VVDREGGQDKVCSRVGGGRCAVHGRNVSARRRSRGHCCPPVTGTVTVHCRTHDMYGLTRSSHHGRGTCCSPIDGVQSGSCQQTVGL